MTQSAQTLRKKDNCTIIHLIRKVVTYLLTMKTKCPNDCMDFQKKVCYVRNLYELLFYCIDDRICLLHT